MAPRIFSKAMRLAGHHDGHALPAARFGEADLDFHLQFGRQLLQAAADGVPVQVAILPGSLDGHAELAAGDLLFERLDIRLLEEEEVGDAGDHAGLVPADDGDGGESVSQGILPSLPASCPAKSASRFPFPFDLLPPISNLLPAKSFDPNRNFP